MPYLNKSLVSFEPLGSIKYERKKLKMVNQLKQGMKGIVHSKRSERESIIKHNEGKDQFYELIN